MNFLEYLADVMECEYLSDLHYKKMTLQQKQTIMKRVKEDFSAADYREAENYLFEVPQPFTSVQQAKEQIVQRLEDNKE